MNNPWKEIVLSDYESHMSLDSVKQLQMLNHAMKKQLSLHPVSSVMILGIAGGNGLEHIDTSQYKTVYGVDINPIYLQETAKRYADLSGILDCLCLDLVKETNRLPRADYIIANLLIEYIGYETFQKVVRQVSPGYISCIIQINVDDAFVSESPYVKSFDRLHEVHHEIDQDGLVTALYEIGYHKMAEEEYPLPNGKKLVQVDFGRLQVKNRHKC